MPTKDDEDLCGASAVMEEMTDRLYEAENNLESNINRIIQERDKVFDFEKDSLSYFKEHGCLPEWYIRYKLGQRLTLGYNLIRKENGQYKEDKNYSVGYKWWDENMWPDDKLDHWRIHFEGNILCNGGRDPEGCESYLLDLFKNYFFDKKVCIHSHKGVAFYKIFDKSYILKDNEDPWEDDDWIECEYGECTIGVVMGILSAVHKSVFP
jgi:hypothetical protein